MSKPCKCGENDDGKFTFFDERGHARRHPYCKKCRSSKKYEKDEERRREKRASMAIEGNKSKVVKQFRKEGDGDYFLLHDPDGTLQPGVFRDGKQQIDSDVLSGSYLDGTLFWQRGAFFRVCGKRLLRGADLVKVKE